ncbi:MAG TPA: CsbD family protein [Acetobacteraceae bacterium]|nr:CsbD family protein [Acetobacteraceae bacterium]
MDENKVEGTAREWAGKAQDAAGGFVGDTSTQMKGKANEYMGKAQQNFGDMADEARELGTQLAETIKDRPFMALMVAGAAIFALGYMMRR